MNPTDQMEAITDTTKAPVEAPNRSSCDSKGDIRDRTNMCARVCVHVPLSMIVKISPDKYFPCLGLEY